MQYFLRLKQENLILMIIGLITLCFFFFSCKGRTLQYALQEKPAWEGEITIEAQRLVDIGSDILDEQDYFFGYISDISVDQDNCVYVLDNRNGKASKFDSNGKFIRQYGRGKGQGPGEFQFAADICTNLEGSVYISDRDRR